MYVVCCSKAAAQFQHSKNNSPHATLEIQRPQVGVSPEPTRLVRVETLLAVIVEDEARVAARVEQLVRQFRESARLVRLLDEGEDAPHPEDGQRLVVDARVNTVMREEAAQAPAHALKRHAVRRREKIREGDRQ